MIRRKLQAGAGRKVFSALAAMGGFLLVLLSQSYVTKNQIDIFGGLQKVAFVAAAFSVTAYNLRIRVIDLVLKMEVAPDTTMNFCRIARKCGHKLTQLVVLFTLTAIMMGACGFFPSGGSFSFFIAACSTALFACSLIQFLYVIFAFERLERFMLDDAEEKARDREAKRLTSND